MLPATRYEQSIYLFFQIGDQYCHMLINRKAGGFLTFNMTTTYLGQNCLTASFRDFIPELLLALVGVFVCLFLTI